jgi:hypothetical protein
MSPLCLCFTLLLARWVGAALPLPQAGDSGTSALAYMQSLSTTDECFARAYIAFNSGECFSYVATTLHVHARSLTMCQQAAFQRTMNFNDTEFYTLFSAYTLHLDSLCYYFQSRSWHRTLALHSAEARATAGEARATADSLTRGLSSLAAHTGSLASGLDVAARSERVRAAVLHFILWLCVPAAVVWLWPASALATLLFILQSVALIGECALATFHGGALAQGGAWWPQTLPALAASLFCTLPSLERDLAVAQLREMHWWAAAALAAGELLQWLHPPAPAQQLAQETHIGAARAGNTGRRPRKGKSQ